MESEVMIKQHVSYSQWTDFNDRRIINARNASVVNYPKKCNKTCPFFSPPKSTPPVIVQKI